MIVGDEICFVYTENDNIFLTGMFNLTRWRAEKDTNGIQHLVIQVTNKMNTDIKCPNKKLGQQEPEQCHDLLNEPTKAQREYSSTSLITK